MRRCSPRQRLQQTQTRKSIMKNRYFNYAKTIDTNVFCYNRVADAFTSKLDWYDNDDVDMIIVDASNTSQETDNIFSFLYQTEPNTDQVWMRFAKERKVI
jgi:hypothetical protein